MTDDISLAEWIAGLRAQLTEAIQWQNEREAAAAAGAAVPVPPLKLEELKLEVEVRATRETTAKGGLKFWVLSGDASYKQSAGVTQRVTLKLAPMGPVYLGDEEGFLPK